MSQMSDPKIVSYSHFLRVIIGGFWCVMWCKGGATDLYIMTYGRVVVYCNGEEYQRCRLHVVAKILLRWNLEREARSGGIARSNEAEFFYKVKIPIFAL